MRVERSGCAPSCTKRGGSPHYTPLPGGVHINSIFKAACYICCILAAVRQTLVQLCVLYELVPLLHESLTLKEAYSK